MMKICDIYSYNSADEHLNSLENIYTDIKKVLNNHKLKFAKGNTRVIKKTIREEFTRNGWVDNVKIAGTHLSISFLKSRVGICFQLGNVSRTYADILKIQYLVNSNVIDLGILIVPHQLESKMLGQNYARYDRLVSELELFNKFITIPILLIGLSN